MDIYETENSRYEIDLPAKRYRRTAIRPDEADDAVDSPRLVRGEWLPLQDTPAPVTIMDDPYDQYKSPEMRAKVLHIMHESSTKGILTSPITFMALDVEVAS